jgi:hypothetical protein
MAADKTVARDIARLRREIQQIEDYVYPLKGDLETQRFFLQLKRSASVRGIVLEFHVALEDLLTDWLKAYLVGVRPEDLYRLRGAKALREALDGILSGGGSIGFDKKLMLLRGFRLIRRSEHTKLTELNRLRNKCGHKWELDALLRRNIKRHHPKRHLIEFRGRSILNPEAVREFAGEYGNLYYKLFLRFLA